ncbi:MAG: sigma-70 family RNA polymerase sigma factor [Polyangiaceae bacterium]
MNTENDDNSLLAAWRAGDKHAGEALFERYFDSIYRFFERNTRGDVSDLVQRTFLGCIEARDRFQQASSFRTFLFAIARNELFGHYRSRKKDGVLDFSVSSLAELAPTPSTLARQRSEREVLLDALRSLPLELQLAVELRFWENLSGPELATVLEIPEGTVRSRLRRALEMLLQTLESQGDASSFVLTSGSDLEAWAVALSERVRLSEE